MSTDAFVLPCPSCLQKNRVLRTRIGDRPICSNCRTPLLTEHPIDLDERAFDVYVGASELPVVVDFWAAWCGPCRIMAPRFEAAAQQLLGRAQFCKLDTEAAPAIAARFAVTGIPTVVLLRDGREAARQTGAMSTTAITSWLAAHGV